MRRDVAVVMARDPAARSRLEIALTYPGLHAVWGHRLSHRLWTSGHVLAARVVAGLVRMVTAVDIHPGATIGRGLFIDHAIGVVIGETATIGDDVTIFHGVTLGGLNAGPGRRHPVIGNRVLLGAGAKILGPITIGDDAKVGANAVVLDDVAPATTVVGVPARPLSETGHTRSTEDVASLEARVRLLASYMAAADDDFVI
jgi:serine O-acetyltransferase